MKNLSMIKSETASALAMLINRPGIELSNAIDSGELYGLLEIFPAFEKQDTAFLMENKYTLDELTDLYNSEIDPAGHTTLLPVESLYKPWTCDNENGLLHGEKGFFMGDPAMHMLELYRRHCLEVPEEFRSMPDHLALELDFLSILYEKHPEDLIYQFIKDHLDWIPDLLSKCAELGVGKFYHSVIRIIDVFIKSEQSHINIINRVIA